MPQHSTSTSQPIYPILIPLSATSCSSLQHIFFLKFNLFDTYLTPLQPMAGSHQLLLRLLRDESGDCRACSTPILLSSRSVPRSTYIIPPVSDVTRAGGKMESMVDCMRHLRNGSGDCQACSTPISFSSRGVPPDRPTTFNLHQMQLEPTTRSHQWSTACHTFEEWEWRLSSLLDSHLILLLQCTP